MLNTILVIVTIKVLTPNALASGAATGVRDVWQQLMKIVMLAKKKIITNLYGVVLYCCLSDKRSIRESVFSSKIESDKVELLSVSIVCLGGYFALS